MPSSARPLVPAQRPPARKYEAENPSSAGAPAGAEGLLGGSETVLAVDDEASVRGVTRILLRRLGYAVLQAGSLEEAVVAAHASERRVDLLLADVVMPGAGGPAVAERLRGECPGLRVLFMSGYTSDEVVRHAVAAGEVNFIQKPFTQRDLARKVRQALDGPA